jgi:hypothetical protein
MWEELFSTGSTEEIVQVLLVLFGMGAAVLTPFVWIASKVLALRERPERRALITTAAAYGCAALLLVFGSGGAYPPLFAPLMPLPWAVVTYLWLRRTYRAAWLEDNQIHDGIKLENSDWRIGVGVVVSVIVAATIKAAFRGG